MRRVSSLVRRPNETPRANTQERLRIAVVSPLYPTDLEPYRGWPIYQTVGGLAGLADVKVFCATPVFPKWRLLQPRSMRYHGRVSGDYAPGSVTVEYLHYTTAPVIGRPLNGLQIMYQLEPAIKRYEPDVILAYWLYPDAWAALQVGKRLGVPVVVGSRGSDAHPQDPLTRMLSRNAVRGASAVLAVSEDIRRILLTWRTASDRTHAILNGVNTAVFHTRDRNTARRDLDVKVESDLVVFVGWLSALKGVPELISALEILVRTHPHIECVFIGEGPLETVLRERNKRGILAGRIRVLGRQRSPEIAQWLAAADVFCLPSQSEGCPNVVIEALASGRPVVATRVGGTPEVVTDECGLLVPSCNPAALASGLQSALAHSWDEAAISARWSRSWEEVAVETYNVCSSVIASASRSL